MSTDEAPDQHAFYKTKRMTEQEAQKICDEIIAGALGKLPPNLQNLECRADTASLLYMPPDLQNLKCYATDITQTKPKQHD